jgi:hyperosmotically inducible periplasmic protein
VLMRTRILQVRHAWIVAATLMALVPTGASAQQKGVGFDDAMISEMVLGVIGNDRSLRRMDIAVSTSGRVVRLRGFVDSLPQAERAGALARGVRGVSQVKNDLRVADRPTRA